MKGSRFYSDLNLVNKESDDTKYDEGENMRGSIRKTIDRSSSAIVCNQVRSGVGCCPKALYLGASCPAQSRL